MGNQLLAIEADSSMIRSDTAKRRDRLSGGSSRNNTKSSKLRTGFSALFWSKSTVRSVQDSSPASTTVSVKSLHADVQQQQQRHIHTAEGNINDHGRRSHRAASTYDSLNLDESVLEADADEPEEDYIDLSNQSQVNVTSTIGSSTNNNQGDRPPPERFLFRPITSDFDRPVNNNQLGFGVDPEFATISSQFQAKRNRNFELNIQ